ncbi:hypothetical protein RJ641_012849 [Dillenia turbinata]|uniref:Uncharacterized protein n=1 Tax=Dillenia turbinata TaxID=194707 RepID=A0AAN8V437_9MAGN
MSITPQELQSAQIQLNLGEAENAANGDIKDDQTQRPWQTGVNGQPSEEVQAEATMRPRQAIMKLMFWNFRALGNSHPEVGIGNKDIEVEAKRKQEIDN